MKKIIRQKRGFWLIHAANHGAPDYMIRRKKLYDSLLIFKAQARISLTAYLAIFSHKKP